MNELIPEKRHFKADLHSYKTPQYYYFYIYLYAPIALDEFVWASLSSEEQKASENSK